MNKKNTCFMIMFFIIFIAGLVTSIRYNLIAQEKPNIYVKIDSFEVEKYINSDSNSTLYFYKDSCVPCSKFKRKLNKFIINMGIKVYAVNISQETDINDQIIEKFNISYTPTLIIFNKGTELGRIEGNVLYDEIEKTYRTLTNY